MPGSTSQACGSQGGLCLVCPTASTCGAGSCRPGEMVLFGGSGNGNQDLADTWTYDGSSWTQNTATGPAARASHAMASQGTTVMLFGGSANGGTPLGDTWAFDGASWTQARATGPSARSQHAAATLFTEAVISGGMGASDGGIPTPLDDTWTFDGTTWTQVTGPEPAARTGVAMAGASSALGPSVFLFGGQGSTGTLSDIWSFANYWVPLSADGPSARSGHAMAGLGSLVVLFGGFDSVKGAALGDTWTFNGQSWTQVAVVGPPARFSHAMASIDGHVVLFGGLPGAGGGPLGDTWTFDGNSWNQVVGAGPPARASHAMALLP
jgi:N-acetylneuraminic acid mutarotase